MTTVEQESERLIEAHKAYAHLPKRELSMTKKHRLEIELENAIQSAIITATTARDSHDEFEVFNGEDNYKWHFFNDVLTHLKNML